MFLETVQHILSYIITSFTERLPNSPESLFIQSPETRVLGASVNTEGAEGKVRGYASSARVQVFASLPRPVSGR